MHLSTAIPTTLHVSPCDLSPATHTPLLAQAVNRMACVRASVSLHECLTCLCSCVGGVGEGAQWSPPHPHIHRPHPVPLSSGWR